MQLVSNSSVLAPSSNKHLACYHCSQPCEEDTPFKAELAGQWRLFCCAGCQAIAQTIHGQGLEAFYQRRQAMEPPKDGVVEKIPDELLAYDDPALLDRYAPIDQKQPQHVRSTTLRLENIRCAACVWLNEQHWRQIPGVIEVQVNYATQRARIQFDDQQCHLSQLLFAARQIGYLAWPFDPSASADLAKAEQRSLLFRVGVALLGMMQVMMYAWPTYTDSQELTQEHAQLMGWASWLLTLPVIFYSAKPIFISAWHSLKLFRQTRLLGMDVPVALALALAFIAGTMNLIRGDGQTYFDSITMFVAFLLLARYVELRARHSASGGAEALARQIPATCELLDSNTNQIKVVPVVRLVTSDTIRVSPGHVVPVDGEMLSQEGSVSEALLTGESRPVAKLQGQMLYAGSHNLGTPLLMRVTATGQATRMAGIAGLLEEALATKPALATLAEKWAAYFVLVLMILAFGTGLYGYIAQTGDAWVRAVAVLVVSCPCALSLAAPAALAAAQGALAKIGLLVVKGHALEGLSNVTDLVLDKTGTLTSGELSVVDVTVVDAAYTKEQVIQVAARLESGQSHPLAAAIIQRAQLDGFENQAQDHAHYEVGHGVKSGSWYLGSPSWLESLGKKSDSTFLRDSHVMDESKTILGLAHEEKIIAYFVLQDEARQGALELIQYAKNAQMKIHLISGDEVPAVTYWANQFGIEHYFGRQLPEDKLAYIQALQKNGVKVLAIGDGINDGPQLAQADVSMAVGQGVPLAQAGADVILVEPSLLSVAKGLRHAKKTRDVIRQNLIWAFIYNVTAIPLAMTGWINPWIAGIGMSLSSLLVTLNAWRLRKI
jgi:Cu2+-exporting ATPase